MPQLTQDGNSFPYTLVDAPWKVTAAMICLAEIATLITVYGFSGFIPRYVPLLVLIGTFCTLYPINLLLFRLMRQNDTQRLHLQRMAAKLQEANQQLADRQQSLQLHRDELERQNHELNTFARTLAHDLKNLLAVVVQNNDLLVYYLEAKTAGPVPGLERLQRAASRSHDAARLMARIVDAVLLLAGVSVQQHAPLQVLAMATILSEAQKRLASSIANYQATINVATTWPPAIGYAPWVEEIWVNYMENAVKYGGRPPHLEIGGETLGNGFVRFWVQDNGLGLTPEQQQLLFVEFTQLKRLDQSSYGLGLSIAKHIAEKLGGTVGVESESGQGSKFYFTLPAADGEG
jgi:two-component system, sensor histidine kinase and response regulator